MPDCQEQLEELSRLADCPHVLVVDDDERLRQLLLRFLRERDFLVTTAVDAADARAKMEHFIYDLVLLDVMMPGQDGIAFSKSLRNDSVSTPIILLTAMGEADSRIAGLEAGADDYVAKPFEPRELLLRMQAVLRRARPAVAQSRLLRLGRWTLDLARGEITSDETGRLLLTQAEQSLLKALAARKGEPVSREDLAKACGLDAAERTIDVQVTRLRKKIEEDQKLPRHIQTVRGKGYVLWVDE